MDQARISVVTPTLRRPREVGELLANLAAQTLLPAEVILVDGAPAAERATEEVVAAARPGLPFPCRHLRGGGGTALQRNAGIDIAGGDFIAFIDDDIRLEPDFFARLVEVFVHPGGDGGGGDKPLGGATGYITNQHLDPATSPRWRWYRRLRLFTTYEPGRYDFETGYPINRYLQPPHEGVREIDFMGAGCALWRAEVFARGLRFAPFFTGYGVLEDAHLALRAGRRWRLVECGRARCVHLRSPGSRAGGREVAAKSALNYRYVFLDVVPRRGARREWRFWRVQLVDLARLAAHALRRPSRHALGLVVGKVEGMARAAWLRAPEAGEGAP